MAVPSFPSGQPRTSVGPPRFGWAPANRASVSSRRAGPSGTPGDSLRRTGSPHQETNDIALALSARPFSLPGANADRLAPPLPPRAPSGCRALAHESAPRPVASAIRPVYSPFPPAQVAQLVRAAEPAKIHPRVVWFQFRPWARQNRRTSDSLDGIHDRGPPSEPAFPSPSPSVPSVFFAPGGRVPACDWFFRPGKLADRGPRSRSARRGVGQKSTLPPCSWFGPIRFAITSRERLPGRLQLAGTSGPRGRLIAPAGTPGAAALAPHWSGHPSSGRPRTRDME